MKKLICLVLCTLLLTSAFVPAVSAEYKEERIDFDDGSYLIFTDEPIPVPPSGPDDTVGSEDDYQDSAEESAQGTNFLTRVLNWIKRIIKLLTKQKNIKKIRYCYYYDANGTLLWDVHLSGEFVYNGKGSTCVKSEITYIIRDSDWKMISCSSTEDGNTAKGEFAIRQYKLGVPLKLIEKTLTITCDKDGNIT